MRRAIRSIAILFAAVVGVVGVAMASTLSAAVTLAATALIVPGTGTPNANNVSGYLQQSRDRYLTTTACGADGSGCPNSNLHGINYPASFFPLVIFPGWCRSGPDGCDKWDDSVGMGAAALQSQLADALNNTNDDIVVFGYSQGGAVVADVLDNYISGLGAGQKARIQIVTIGGIENPDGGLWQRLAFLNYIPLLNISFNPPMTPDTGVNFTSYGFEYDPVVNAPRYWGNPFALLNAVAALETVHGYYLAPNGNGPTDTLPYGYTDATLAPQLDCSANPGNCRFDKYGNTYVTIPATSLPLAEFILSNTPGALTPIVKPFVDLVAPAYRVLADLGYNYSGDPSVPTPLSILPFDPFTFNPVGFAANFAGAIAEGVHDAVNGGPPPPPAPPALAPTPVPAVKPVTPNVAAGGKSGAAGNPGSLTTLSSSNSASSSNSESTGAQITAVKKVVPATGTGTPGKAGSSSVSAGSTSKPATVAKPAATPGAAGQSDAA